MIYENKNEEYVRKEMQQLNQILSRKEMLTYEDLKFLVDMLPHLHELPQEYIKRIEERLKKDYKRKRKEYGRWIEERGLVLIYPADFFPKSFCKISSKLSPYERIRRYLAWEKVLEDTMFIATLALDTFEGRIEFNEALRRVWRREDDLVRRKLLRYETPLG